MGKLIFLLEDDALIAMDLAERIESLGLEVLGPASTLEEADQLLSGRRPDAALLDANVHGKSSVVLAERLHADGVPLAFCTGYEAIAGLPSTLKRAPLLRKPISDDQLEQATRALLA